MTARPIVLLATTNAGKLREIRALLADVPVDLQGLGDYPSVPEPDETGETFAENARVKARAYASALGRHLEAGSLVVAEDSGLAIDALDGEPGVRSARFLGPAATYAERFETIERRLAAQPSRSRTAHFVCALAVADLGGRIAFETSGTVEGLIASAPAGTHGFGYDPIFFHPPLGRTLAEASDEEKRAVSHRGQAFRALGGWLTATNPDD
jgi:XTP/dITP diphosphohydrolase